MGAKRHRRNGFVRYPDRRLRLHLSRAGFAEREHCAAALKTALTRGTGVQWHDDWSINDLAIVVLDLVDRGVLRSPGRKQGARTRRPTEE